MRIYDGRALNVNRLQTNIQQRNRDETDNDPEGKHIPQVELDYEN